MTYELDTPDIETTQAVGNVDQPYTHVILYDLRFRLPLNPADEVSATFKYVFGNKPGGGDFVPIFTFPYLEEVPDGPVRNFLLNKDTRNKRTIHKLQEAMMSRLFSTGRVKAGTIIEIP